MLWSRHAVLGLFVSLSAFLSSPAWSALPRVPPEDRCKVDGNVLIEGPVALKRYARQVASFLVNKRGDVLERMLDEWSAGACMFDDGRPWLTAWVDGHEDAFTIENDWSKNLDYVSHLKQTYPDTALSSTAEIQYWTSFAWHARGHGYANSVTQDGWRLYRERLEKAETIAIAAKSHAAVQPMWYEQMLWIQGSLGRPAAERDKVFLEGAKKFKLHYPIYMAMLEFMMPQWGGNWDMIDRLIAWSVENTKETEGNSLYARLYWMTYTGLRQDTKFFGGTRASWPKMKSGFEDLMKRHPKSKWNLNNFAKFACLAGDKKTFLQLRRQIGKDVIKEAWPEGVALDLCEYKYGSAK